MLKSDMKRVIDKLEPDRGMEYRIAEKMERKQRRQFRFKPAIAVVGLAVVLCTGVIAYNLTNPNIGIIRQAGGVYIPKFELPENGAASAKMMPLIVYRGRVYLLSATQIDPQNTDGFLGEKLGTTKGNLTEWSKQDDYAVEFASTVGVQEVYAVQGYDKNFRIMTLEKLEGVAYPLVFECLNDITVKTGKDIFDKLKIENNIEAIRYEGFESWNNGLQQVQTLADIGGADGFVRALYRSAPIEQEKLPTLWDDQSPDSQKFVTLTLKDLTQVQLRMFKEGYVYYNGVDILFKVDSAAFERFWNDLK